jgi:hypothetical protein
MKTILKIYLALILFTFSIGAVALNVEGYRSLIEKSRAGDSNSQHLLLGYHQGLTEAFTQTLLENNGVIKFEGKDLICVPSDVKLTSNIIEAAIDSAFRGKNNLGVSDDLEKLQVGTYAYVGLWKLFPCKLP